MEHRCLCVDFTSPTEFLQSENAWKIVSEEKTEKIDLHEKKITHSIMFHFGFSDTAKPQDR